MVKINGVKSCPHGSGILQKGSEGVCPLIPMHTEEPHALCPGLFLSLMKIKESIFQKQREHVLGPRKHNRSQ